MKIVPGDIFCIKTSKGYGFVQYIETDNLGIEYVRVLFPLKAEPSIDQKDVDQKERLSIGFPLKASIRKKILLKIENLTIPANYKLNEFSRSKHILKGEFLGWYIINRLTLERELKVKLGIEDLKLSPYGIFNDTLLIEYLEKDWRLEDWK